ncbi:MAG TPA: DUF4900 domain-containing protein, partial [Deinococcales bacterium]|nr:DUF4900 domain-containing protein [Deinococcales bacterium]
GRYLLQGNAQNDMRSVFNPYVSAFTTAGKDPAVNWVIDSSLWPQVATDLQSALNGDATNTSVPAGNLTTGTASMAYLVTNFRGETQGITTQHYLADYVLTSTGSLNTGGARRRVEDKGYIDIQIGRSPLSQWMFLVDNAMGDRGFFGTGDKFDGPTHANSNWGFWGTPEFMDRATTSDNYVYFYDRNFSKQHLQADSLPPFTVPVFHKGFQRGVPRIDLPVTAISQVNSALGFDPTSATPPTVPDVCTALRLTDIYGTPSRCRDYTSIPTGAYLATTNGTAVTGGFYVQGDVDRLTLSQSNGIQTYTFVQGSHTTRFVVNYALNLTTVTYDGTVRRILTGVPNGPATVGTGSATGQIYVNGSINNLDGGSRSGAMPNPFVTHPIPAGVPRALAKETQLNITAKGTVNLTTDLVYECDPTQVVTDTTDRCYNAGNPVNTVLGVMSETDNVVMTTSTPDDVMLWGSYLSGTSGKGLTVQNYSSRSAQGQMRLFGGLIQSADQLRGQIDGSGNLLHGYRESYEYDRRFSNGALAPPNFPTTRTFDVQDVTPVPTTYREY